MNRARTITNRIEAKLRVISGLASILMNTDAIKNGSHGEEAPQLELQDETVLHEALFMFSEQTHDDLVELMNAVEIPA